MRKLLGIFTVVALIIGVFFVTPKTAFATGGHDFNICDILPWLPICNEEEEPPVDYCETVEGVQNEQYDCPAPEEPVDYCDTLEGVQAEDADCPEVTPTPTEEPEVTPTPTEEPKGTPPTFVGSSTEAPGVCGDARPTRVANINVVSHGVKGELEVQWALPTGGDRVHIEYGLGQNAEHALLNTPNDGNEIIGGLNSGSHYWFRVAGVNGCAVGDYSGWFDPIAP